MNTDNNDKKESPEEIVRTAVADLRSIAKAAAGAGDHATARAAHAEVIKAAYWLLNKDK